MHDVDFGSKIEQGLCWQKFDDYWMDIYSIAVVTKMKYYATEISRCVLTEAEPIEYWPHQALMIALMIQAIYFTWMQWQIDHLCKPIYLN